MVRGFNLLNKTMKVAGLSIATLVVTACGDVHSGKRSGGESDLTQGDGCGADGDRSPSQIRLKGTSLLAQSLEYTLGAGKDVNINNTDERLLETYSSNFGNTQGLSFGEIYADIKSEDIKMTGYMMGLNIIAYNAALRCAGDSFEGKCDCATETSAAAMLRRALPYMNFCDGDDTYVAQFASLCANDGVGAVTALISSTAFAMRN